MATEGNRVESRMYRDTRPRRKFERGPEVSWGLRVGGVRVGAPGTEGVTEEDPWENPSGVRRGQGEGSRYGPPTRRG